MSIELLLSLVAFAFATSATPGPNTMMLLASGVNFGVRRTLPHIFGINVGFGSMLVIVGIGLGALIVSSPVVGRTLKIASVVYMLWLAWRIATSTGASSGDNRARPFSFVEAALFQWINPKAWAIALAGVPAYTLADQYALSLTVLVIAFLCLNVPIGLAWTGFGVGLRRFLDDPQRRRAFNIGMGLLLAASLYPMARELVVELSSGA